MKKKQIKDFIFFTQDLIILIKLSIYYIYDV